MITAVTATAAVLLTGCGTRGAGGQGRGSHPAAAATASGQAVRPGAITMASVSCQPRSLPAGIDSAELDAAVVHAPGGGSLVRADADAIWYPARSRITFVPAASTVPRIVATPSGCMTVGVMVAGAAQPLLWGDTGLIGAAKRLLHVKTVL